MKMGGTEPTYGRKGDWKCADAFKTSQVSSYAKTAGVKTELQLEYSLLLDLARNRYSSLAS
jgi:hypothetical protein